MSSSSSPFIRLAVCSSLPSCPLLSYPVLSQQLCSQLCAAGSKQVASDSMRPNKSLCRGNKKRQFQEIERDQKEDDKTCKHVYLTQWGVEYHCVDCYDLVTDPRRICLEEKERARIKSIDARDSDLFLQQEKLGAEHMSQRRGVPIGWLVQWTSEHDCWQWSTRRVQRDLILPHTSSSRCRYVELEAVRGIVGPASTFISHTWEAPFGDLVAAVADGADLSRRVWLDIFAVRQWPGNSCDMDFGGTVRLCSSLVLVCTSLGEIAALHGSNKPRRIELISADTRKQVAFFRAWCLLEFHTAVLSNVVVIMKGGSHSRQTNGTFSFESNNAMLNILTQLIDINQAEASVPSDRERILNMIEESEGGTQRMNDMARSIIAGSFSCSGDSLVQCAVCGDQAAIRTVTQPATAHLYLLQAAGVGCVSLVQALLSAGADVNTVGERGSTALTEAAWGGHVKVVALLLERGGNEGHRNEQGRAAVHWAALQGHVACLELLLDHGSSSLCSFSSTATSPSPFINNANINSRDGLQFTPLMFAARNGHASCVRLLIARGGDVNLRCSYGRAALGFAAKYGNLTCVQLLLEGGANVTFCDIKGKSEGFTALQHARSRGHDACVKLLTAHGALL